MNKMIMKNVILIYLEYEVIINTNAVHLFDIFIDNDSNESRIIKYK